MRHISPGIVVSLFTPALFFKKYFFSAISFLLDISCPLNIIGARAGVVKLVDAGDSKSPFPCESVGSIPTSGTIWNQRVAALAGAAFFVGTDHQIAPMF